MGGAAATTQTLEFALRISSLLQSMRAMFAARNVEAVRGLFEQHLLSIILDQIEADSGAVLIEDYASQQTCAVPEHLLTQVTRERAVLSAMMGSRHAALAPLLVRGEVAGIIYLERATPFDDPQLQLLTALAQFASSALEAAYHQEFLEAEVERLEQRLAIDLTIAGQSAKVEDLRARIARTAASQATVLITGESGTGKELVARSLHRQSPRATAPFVAINCAALTDTLLESELFGHEKGAFTGAVGQKRGRLECAEGGTVFLDEIGEMPLLLQSKMLRVLQAREFERVGGTRTIPLNVRVIAATNRNLEDAVAQGVFRQDLYYRLKVVVLRTPPLRERPEDIVLLANEFATRFAAQCGRRLAGISPDARALLRHYQWPGNVRELENAMEHAVVMGTSDMIRCEDLPECLRETQPIVGAAPAGLLQDAINAAKRTAVERAFEQTEYDHNEAARLLGVHPNYLYRLIRNMDLQALLKTAARE